MTMNSRTIAMVIDADFDRPIIPRLIRDLYWIFQAFTAALAAIALIWLLVEASNPILFLVGLGLAPVGWFVATMALRMFLELALVVFDLHDRMTRKPNAPPHKQPPTIPPIPPSFGLGKAIER